MQFLLKALSPSTDAGYSPGLDEYLAFCSCSGSEYPPDSAMVLAFATHLASVLQFPARKVRRYVTALRSFCVEGGAPLSPFDDARLARLYRGIARSQPPPAPGSARPRRLPITGPILAGLVRHARLLKQPAKARAMAAALAMGFFGLLRAGEFAFKGAGVEDNKYTLLRRADVSWGVGFVDVFLAESKTDHSRKGVTIRIFKCPGRPVCPYELLRGAWDLAPDARLSAPLLQAGPSGDPLTYRELLGFIKATLPLLGFPAALFGTHSLRIGGATQMALSGYSAAQIQAAGRWSSDCYLVYIRLGDAFFRSLASALSASADSSLSPFGPLSAVQAASASFDNLPALVARSGTF